MGRLASGILLIAALALNVLALCALSQVDPFRDGSWAQPLAFLGGAYDWIAHQFDRSLSTIFASPRPALAHLAIAYLTTASAITLAAATFARSRGWIESVKTSVLALAWPFGILFYAWRAFRLNLASDFDRRQAVILASYVLCVGGAFAVLQATAEKAADEAAIASRETIASPENNARLAYDVASGAPRLSSAPDGVFLPVEEFVPSSEDDKILTPSVRGETAAISVQTDPALQAKVAEIVKLNNKAVQLNSAGRYSEALAYAQQALALAEEALGPNHTSTLALANNVGAILRALGRYSEAEPIHERVLDSLERVLGPDHPGTLIAVNNLGALYQAEGRYAEAEPLYIRAYETRKRVLGPEHRDTLVSENNLATLYVYQGRYAEAEALFLRTLSVRERTLGYNHPDTLYSVSNLSALYETQGRHKEALTLAKRAVQAREQVLGPTHPDTLTSISNLAGVYESLGDYVAAIANYKRALAGFESMLGAQHPYSLSVASNLAYVYQKAGDYAQAEASHRRILADRERMLGPSHPETLNSLINLSQALRAQQKFAEAETLLIRVRDVAMRDLGASHIVTNTALNNLAVLYQVQGRYDEGALAFAQALDGFSSGFFGSAGDEAGRDAARSVMTREGLMPNVYDFVATAPETPNSAKLASSILSASQLLKDSSVSAEIARGAARLASNNPALKALIKTYDEQFVAQARANSELNFQLNKPVGERDEALLASARSAMNAANAELRRIQTQIRTQFPDYAALSIPEGVPAAQVGSLLQGGDEAFVAFATAGEKGELIAVVVHANGAASSVAIPVSREELERSIKALRAGVTLPSGGAFAPAALAALSFDMSAATKLYDALISPLEAKLGGAGGIVIAPDGPLESLPFNLLAVAEAANPDPADAFARYRGADWLIDRYALSTVPTVSALKQLRRKGAPSAEKPFVGFGDPVLQGSVSAAPKAPRRITLGGSGATNVQAIRELTPVPQTGAMLNDLAAALGASSADVYTGARGSEGALAALNATGGLSKYRVAAFATHALVAGELQRLGLDEPALVLTPPANDNPQPADDGLLRASEVVGLSMNADWVLLTACNTAADDGALGAEPLSGLAKSFFYAGARSILVSHWPAEANATARLATAMIREKEAGASKARALQTAMRAMKADRTCPAGETARTDCPENAHPALWGGFAIVGEGR
ncbi:MAG: CHAT domain-containing tetratricopeptide repeat protein [Parvularculaceae bacterium]